MQQSHDIVSTLATDAQAERLSIGICYQKEMHAFLLKHLDALDYLEIVPDTAWTDHGAHASPRYVNDTETLGFFQAIRRQVPIVGHSIGLSIGSAHRFRQEHLEQVRQWDALLDFPWHSDHLAFNIVSEVSGTEYLLGVPFPVTLDIATLELLVPRIQQILDTIPKPFLLENNVSYIQYLEQDFDEATFLNEICSRSGCQLLLDLHNLYVDGRNQAVDIDNFLASLDLSHVIEVHLAGGLTYNGVYLDAHSGGVPEDVWRMAENILPRCPNVKGITFELLGSWFERLGEPALLETVMRMRALAKSTSCGGSTRS